MSFAQTRHVKASRKARSCDHCCQPIEIGSPYRYVAWHDEDCGLGDCHVHEECHAFVWAYTCTDEGFSFLCDLDPSEEYELADDIKAKPPTAAMLARLPPAWRMAVDAILADAEPVTERLL